MSATQPAIPGYTLGGELGHGGMGVVWSAVEDATGDSVAVKVFETAGAGEAAALLAEARRAAAVDHPGIVRVRDHGSADGTAWIVMDLVPGRDLRRYVRDTGPLRPERAARIVAAAADALAAVHAAGLVHRDVKPANILLDETGGEPDGGAVRLADFGVAAPAMPDDALSDAGEWANSAGDPGVPAGTFAYMAPEQWRGEPPTVRGDVYGLGGVLFTALTGEPPYPHESLPELAYAVAMSPVPRAADLRPELPPAYDDVIAAALAKDPAGRVPSAAALAAVLRDVAQGGSLELPPASGRPPHRTGASRATRPPRRYAAAVAVLAGLGAGLLAWHPWSAGHGSGGRPLRRVVCARDLELRDGPRGRQTGTLRHGDAVTVLRRDTSQSWAYVSAGDGRHGWVLGSWLRPSCRRGGR